MALQWQLPGIHHTSVGVGSVCVYIYIYMYSVDLGLSVSCSEAEQLQDKRDLLPVYTDIKEDFTNPNPSASDPQS